MTFYITLDTEDSGLEWITADGFLSEVWDFVALNHPDAVYAWASLEDYVDPYDENTVMVVQPDYERDEYVKTPDYLDACKAEIKRLMEVVGHRFFIEGFNKIGFDSIRDPSYSEVCEYLDRQAREGTTAVRVYDIGDEDDEPLLVLFPGRDIPGVE